MFPMTVKKNKSETRVRDEDELSVLEKKIRLEIRFIYMIMVF